MLTTIRTARATRALALTAAVALTGALSAASAIPASAAPADGVRDSQQWALDMMNVPAAWAVSQGAGVTVAVVDSGVNPSVSDLAGSVTPGPDLTGLGTSPSNSSWGVHGTWMASIIAGHGHNGGGDGITGVAPRAKLLAIRVIPDQGDPGFNKYDSEPEQQIQQSLATGIRDAAKDGAQVISMSIGYSGASSAVRSAIQYAESRGVVLVASSGNSGEDLSLKSHGLAPISFPADYPGVLSVAAVDATGAVAQFSSNNLSVQVAAPGVNVPAQGRDGQYWLVSGTSPACALVAGAAALIKSRYPGLAPALVDEALTSTAKNGLAGYNPKSGFGTINVAKALHEAGVLAAQSPGKSPEAATGQFGGGPSAVPAVPVPPRGAGQQDLYLLAGLVAALLVIGGVLWLWLGRRRARSGPADPAPYAYPAGPPAAPPSAQPYPGAPPVAPSAQGYPASSPPGWPQYGQPPARPAAPQYPGQFPASGQQHEPPWQHPSPEGYQQPYRDQRFQ